MATVADRDTLTRRQREVFEFLYSTARDHGYMPTFREIGAHLGITANNAISVHLRPLVRKGWLARSGGGKTPYRLACRPDGEPFTGFADKPSSRARG